MKSKMPSNFACSTCPQNADGCLAGYSLCKNCADKIVRWYFEYKERKCRFDTWHKPSLIAFLNYLNKHHSKFVRQERKEFEAYLKREGNEVKEW